MSQSPAIAESDAALREAQAEIERLKAGGCARDQRTTQWCAEAVAMRAERDALLKLLAEAEAAIRDLVDAADLSAHTYLDLSNRMIDALAKEEG